MASIVAAAWPSVALGEVLKKSDEWIDVDPSQEYAQVTVRLWGKGVALRGHVQGAEIAASRQLRVRPNQFILSRIDARNGAFGLVPADLDGAIVSNDFPAFDVSTYRLDPSFLQWMSRTHDFVELCQRASEGTTNRVRLQESRFLATEIPLPPLDEQRRIVARIEALAARIEQARGLRREALAELERLIQRVWSDVLQTSGTSKISDFVSFQHGYAFESHLFTATGIRLVRNINIGHGSIRWDDTAYFPESERSRLSRFELHEGDILLSLNRPVISTGVKAARVSANDIPSLLVQRVGRVLFSNPSILPDYFFAWLRSPAFVAAIATRLHGVPYITTTEVEQLPFAPPPPEKQCQIVAYLNEVQARMDTLKYLQAGVSAELDALLPSILDKAFRGEL